MDKIIEKQDKTALGSFVQKVIKDMAYSKKFKNELLMFLKDRVAITKINNILNSRENDISLLNNNDIYWFAKFLNAYKSEYQWFNMTAVLFNKVTDIDSYFTQKEKNDAESVLLNKDNNRNMIVIEGVEKMESDMYICTKCSYAKIAEIINNGFGTYNFDVQREATPINNGISIINTPTIYRENIMEIKEAMIKRDFEPNMLTGNILNTGEEEFDYDEETKTLVLKQPMNIADGVHRILSLMEALIEDPTLADNYFILKITNYDVYKANQRIVLQESKGARISVTKQKTLELTQSMRIAKKINEFGSKEINVMRNMISDNEKEVFGVKNKACLFTAISEVIDEKYQDVLNYPSDINVVSQYLIDFFGEFASYTPKAFFDITVQESKEKYCILYNNTFMLLTYLAKLLYDRADRQKILRYVIENNDFSVESPLSKALLLESKRHTATIKNDIYNWVDEQITKYDNKNKAIV